MIDQAKVLKNESAFFEFIKDNFDIRFADFQIEALSYAYLADPPKLEDFLILHMTLMWEKYLSQQWNKYKTMLSESVSASQQLNLEGMDRKEAVRIVTNHQVEEEWQDCVWQIE